MTDPRPLPPSLYAVTARPPVATSPLEGDVRTDVAIIGGGYTGLSTALHLAERGIGCRVLEAHEPGWGASGRNGGQVNPGLYPSPDSIEADFGRDLGRRMFDHAATAPDRLFALVERLGIDCAAARTGTLRVAINARGVAGVRSMLEQWAARGAEVAWRDAVALEAATGTSRYPGGMLFANGGRLNPLGYARGLADAAQAAGALVHGGCRAVRVVPAPGRGWRITTAGGATVEADHIVVGTNGYSDGLWPGVERSVVPVYTAIVASEPLPPQRAARVMPGGSVLYETGHVTVYYRLDEANRLLMGGRSRFDDVTEVREVRHLVAYAERLWPALRGIRWTHAWNGQVAITADHHIHLHEPAETAHICVGYNGRGIAMATAMGEQIAARIAGASASDLPMPVTDLRGLPLHGLWRPVAATRILYGRLRDALGL